eukprot:1136983-Prymnesium_polylepis.1
MLLLFSLLSSEINRTNEAGSRNTHGVLVLGPGHTPLNQSLIHKARPAESADEVEHEAMGTYMYREAGNLSAGGMERYTLGGVYEGKALFKDTFAPRTKEGVGNYSAAATAHWVIGAIPDVQQAPLIHRHSRVHSGDYTVEIIGPPLGMDACGDLIHEHLAEGWSFLDEIKAE